MHSDKHTRRRRLSELGRIDARMVWTRTRRHWHVRLHCRFSGGTLLLATLLLLFR